MQRFDLIIFDMDGLLIDSERIAYEQFIATADEFGIEVSHEAYLECIGANARRVDEILRAVVAGLVDFAEFKAKWRKRYKFRIGNHPIPVKDGVNELLRHIKANGQFTVVATSTETPQAELKLGNAGLLGQFDAIVGGEQVVRGKPAPDIFLKAAELFQATPARCLVLEDSINGVNAAIAAGMRVVQVPDLVDPAPDSERKGVIVLDSLREVASYSF